MLKLGTVLVIVLLLALTIEAWPRGHDGPKRATAARTHSSAAASTCGREVIARWVRDDQMPDGYGRECYQAALYASGDTNAETLYGAPVFADLEERLRA